MVSCSVPHNLQAVSSTSSLINFWRAITLFYVFLCTFPVAESLFTSIQPMNGPLSGGTIFTLSGGSFNTACTTKTCSFNNRPASSITVTGSVITGFVPAYVSGATAPVVVSYGGSGGGSCSTAQSFSTTSLFTYDKPVFEGIFYNAKSTLGGNSISITGKNFLPSSVNIIIGSTSSGCSSITSFQSFKCSIPAFALGTRSGIDLVVEMDSVQTTLIKFAYDAPMLSAILPQVPVLDGISSITVLGSNLESAAPSSLIIGTLPCLNVIVIIPHSAVSCIPGISHDIARTQQLVSIILFSGINLSALWTFEPVQNFLQYAGRKNISICEFSRDN